MITLEPLPYAPGALEPYLAADAVSLHYALYERYVDRTRAYFREKGLQEPGSLDQAMEYALSARDVVLLHNAQQAMNHEVFFASMAPPPLSGGLPEFELSAAMRRQWPRYEQFYEAWVGASVGLFGAGYVWLAYEPRERHLEILALPNSDQPWQAGGKGSHYLPLLCVDLWEHAWIFDWPLRKAEFAETFLRHLVNWRTAEQAFRELQR